MLAVLYSVQLLSPLLSAEPESKLPACCRRDGKHGCSMAKKSLPPSTQGKPSLASNKVTCPLYPTGQSLPVSERAAGTPIYPAAWLPPATKKIDVAEQLEARLRISFSRATQKRGPPSSSAA